MNGPLKARSTYIAPESPTEYSSEGLSHLIEKYAVEARATAYQKAINDAGALIIARSRKDTIWASEARSLRNAADAILNLPNPFVPDDAA